MTSEFNHVEISTLFRPEKVLGGGGDGIVNTASSSRVQVSFRGKRLLLKMRLLEITRRHNSTEHPKLISIPYIYPIGQDISIEI